MSGTPVCPSALHDARMTRVCFDGSPDLTGGVVPLRTRHQLPFRRERLKEPDELALGVLAHRLPEERQQPARHVHAHSALAVLQGGGVAVCAPGRPVRLGQGRRYYEAAHQKVAAYEGEGVDADEAVPAAIKDNVQDNVQDTLNAAAVLRD